MVNAWVLRGMAIASSFVAGKRAPAACRSALARDGNKKPAVHSKGGLAVWLVGRYFFKP
jgi:hypothetical protein